MLLAPGIIESMLELLAIYWMFYFYLQKSVTTGEGGMLTIQSASMGQVACSLRDHGTSRTDLERPAGKYGFLLAEYEHSNRKMWCCGTGSGCN